MQGNGSMRLRHWVQLYSWSACLRILSTGPVTPDWVVMVCYDLFDELFPSSILVGDLEDFPEEHN
jgi:hypothetical protein